MLILEMALTVWAWCRGWHKRALWPVGIVIGVGALAGVLIGASGGSIEDLPRELIVFDLAAIVVLIGMVCRPPKPVQNPSPSLLEARIPTTPVANSAHR